MSSGIVLNLKDKVLATVSAINNSFDIMSSINKQQRNGISMEELVVELLSEIG
jgi:ribosomal protein L31